MPACGKADDESNGEGRGWKRDFERRFADETVGEGPKFGAFSWHAFFWQSVRANTILACSQVTHRAAEAVRADAGRVSLYGVPAYATFSAFKSGKGSDHRYSEAMGRPVD